MSFDNNNSGNWNFGGRWLLVVIVAIIVGGLVIHGMMNR